MPNGPLDYQTPQLLPPNGASATLAACSFACIAVPICGLMIENGPLVICGGAVTPVIGILFGLAGLVRPRASAGVVANCLAIAANVLVGGWICWHVYVHGLC